MSVFARAGARVDASPRFAEWVLHGAIEVPGTGSGGDALLGCLGTERVFITNAARGEVIGHGTRFVCPARFNIARMVTRPFVIARRQVWIRAVRVGHAVSRIKAVPAVVARRNRSIQAFTRRRRPIVSNHAFVVQKFITILRFTWVPTVTRYRVASGSTHVFTVSIGIAPRRTGFLRVEQEARIANTGSEFVYYRTMAVYFTLEIAGLAQPIGSITIGRFFRAIGSGETRNAGIFRANTAVYQAHPTGVL